MGSWRLLLGLQVPTQPCPCSPLAVRCGGVCSGLRAAQLQNPGRLGPGLGRAWKQGRAAQRPPAAPTSAALWPPGPEARGNIEDTEQSPPDSRGQEWTLTALAGARLLAPSLHVVPQALAAYLWGQSWKMAQGAGQVTGSTLLPHPGPCLRPSLPVSRPAGSSCPHRHRCDPGPGEGLAGPCQPCA